VADKRPSMAKLTSGTQLETFDVSHLRTKVVVVVGGENGGG